MNIKYKHEDHPHIEERKKTGPVKVHEKRKDFNSRIAIMLTTAVGTMWCAYAFACLALFALPDALKGGMFPLIQWVSQTFIQLVMLSVIMVGQNILGQAADKRAEATYKDAEATFHEAREIQKHLLEQDAAINAILDRIEKMEANMKS
jgi:hypothetical protein